MRIRKNTLVDEGPLAALMRAEYESPLGTMILAADDTALLGLWFEGQKYFLGALKKERLIPGENPVLEKTKKWLDAYFAGERPAVTAARELAGNPPAELNCPGRDSPDNAAGPIVAFLNSEVPLSPRGTSFQRQVWRLLCEIPYGEVTAYGSLAEKMAKIMGRETMSAQAVGSAVGRNPISVIIPCHRVLGRNGGLTGYAGGLDKKQRLLQMEGVI